MRRAPTIWWWVAVAVWSTCLPALFTAPAPMAVAVRPERAAAPRERAE